MIDCEGKIKCSVKVKYVDESFLSEVTDLLSSGICLEGFE